MGLIWQNSVQTETSFDPNTATIIHLPFSFCSSGNTNSMFALDYISGSLTVSGQLDRENPLYSSGFTITVRVRLKTSGGGAHMELKMCV